MFCKKCGAENPDGARFCVGCGRRVGLRTLPTRKIEDYELRHQVQDSYHRTLAELVTRFGSEGNALAFKEGGLIAHDRYRVERLLGKGGMGCVYLVYDRDMERYSALKMLLPSLTSNKKALRRFINEARISSGLAHENVVNVYDLGRHGDILFISMEYIRGMTLAEWLKANSTSDSGAPLEKVLPIFYQVLEGVGYAHRFTIHRDLKPENIMIEEGGTVKVMDFGIAKAAGAVQFTSSGLAVGTPLYMSPEQAKGGQQDRRSDIYSLGMIFYELLTGTIPQGRFKMPSEIVGGLPASVDGFLDKCLAPDADERFQNINEMKRFLKGVKSDSGTGIGRKVKAAQETAARRPGARQAGVKEEKKRPRKREEVKRDAKPAAAREILKRFGLRRLKDSSYSRGGLPKEARHTKSGIQMVLVPAGEFTMGSEGGYPAEKPAHRVKITRPFYMGRYEVTVKQWKKFLSEAKYRWKKNYSKYSPGDNYPIVCVSYRDAQAFCEWAGLSLPTEAQWEYACRAGTTTSYSFGDRLTVEANHSGAGMKEKWRYCCPVGSLRPNRWGLYDMHGNVWEWCADWYDGYQAGEQADPAGPPKGKQRVLRGGSWSSFGDDCRSSSRSSGRADDRAGYYGFRVVASL